MKIGNIKDKEVMEIALMYCYMDILFYDIYPTFQRITYEELISYPIGGAFIWFETPEGHDFWNKIDCGFNLKLPK